MGKCYEFFRYCFFANQFLQFCQVKNFSTDININRNIHSLTIWDNVESVYTTLYCKYIPSWFTYLFLLICSYFIILALSMYRECLCKIKTKIKTIKRYIYNVLIKANHVIGQSFQSPMIFCLITPWPSTHFGFRNVYRQLL